MSEYVFKLPDLGEGTVEAEIVEWHVTIGDEVREGDVIVDVMTDKANIEVPAPVDGRILRTTGQPGDVVAVGSELVALETVGAAPGARRKSAPEAPAATTPAATTANPATVPETRSVQAPFPQPPATVAPPETAPQQAATERSTNIVTSPALRKRAKEAGVDLHNVQGTGPRGRILQRDLDAYLQTTPVAAMAPAAAAGAADEVEEIKVIGVRRVIAERVSQSKREIPHFAYVEEVDVTELDALRLHLNATHEQHLSVLPFIALALIRALPAFPQCNALFDSAAGVLKRYRAIHLGIATQTHDGLKVPVVRNAQRLNLWQLSNEIARLAEAARSNTASREELVGSTITITSLGRMGGIVTTPVINYPEMGIIGVNKAMQRPMVVNGQVAVRTIMNLSSCFDHRFVDGFDAAAMIQAVKAALEHPATLFMDGP